eukprot:2837199-Karenia_brevis.AAC.1
MTTGRGSPHIYIKRRYHPSSTTAMHVSSPTGTPWIQMNSLTKLAIVFGHHVSHSKLPPTCP